MKQLKKRGKTQRDCEERMCTKQDIHMRVSCFLYLYEQSWWENNKGANANKKIMCKLNKSIKDGYKTKEIFIFDNN